jgi:hypothetical protein
VLHEIWRVRCHKLLPSERLRPGPQRARGLGMQVRLRFFDREDGLNVRLLGLRKLLQDGSLKEEDYRQTLKSLTVMGEWQPRPQVFIAHNYAGSLEHFFNGKRECV